MFTPEIQNLIAENSARFALPPWLISGIIATESGGEPWAVRFEAAFRAHYVPDQCQTFGASHETERTTRACSWGLMQIMGQVAREYGYKGEFLSELCHPATGMEYSCRHLARFRAKYLDSLGWAGVAAAYNAGTPHKDAEGRFLNQQYVDKVMKYQPQEITP